MTRLVADAEAPPADAATTAAATGRVHVPPATADAVYCTLYHREPTLGALAEAELFALGGGQRVERGIWLSRRPIRWATCGYGSGGGRQLAWGATLEALASALRALRLACPTFAITTRRVPRGHAGGRAAKLCVADCIDGDVDEDAPSLRLELVVSASGYRVLVDTEAAPGEGDWQALRHKPHNYLVAVPVRIAKAMLNVTARPGDSVFDPFCGTGTIPLLAAAAGHRAFGSDISAACVAQSGANGAFFGVPAAFACADAREARQVADCIVTNPPYGVYSHFAADAMRASLRNLARLAPRATFVTSARLEEDLAAEGYALEDVFSVEADRFERFVYVTRAPGAAGPAPGPISTSPPACAQSTR